MKRVTLPVFSIFVGWVAIVAGCGLLYGWGEALLGGGIAAVAFSFFAWIWTD